MSSELYREHILDLYKNPHNKGKLENPTHEHTELNTLCGDEMTMQLVIKDEKIVDVKFHGDGCAVSIASASLLTDEIRGMSIKDARKLSRDNILELLHIPISPNRIKCALLSLKTLQEVLKNAGN
jgi:nitrogen fixation NifU-like protein